MWACPHLERALAQTGAAEMLADVFSKMLDGITNGYIVGFTFYVVGFLMTSLLYNRAVSTVLIPLVVITCSSIGCDPRGPIILVGAVHHVLSGHPHGHCCGPYGDECWRIQR